MKKGFTLIELLAVIIIVGLIGLIATPIIRSVIDSAKKDAFENMAYNIKRAAEVRYLDTELKTNSGEIKFTYIDGIENPSIEGEALEYDGKKPQSGEVVITQYGEIGLALYDGKYCAEKEYDEKDIILTKKKAEDCLLPYADNSGAPIPKLADGMIPIKWDGSKWVTTNIKEAWFDYDKQEWANAILVKQEKRSYYKSYSNVEINNNDVLTYLVWIPRYRYKLFNTFTETIPTQTIEIKFESKNAKKGTEGINDTWLTHPAFTLGNKEINGFWVGKFETGGDDTTPLIKPGISSFRKRSVNNQYNLARLFNNSTKYGLTSNFDAHMMKNMEWGATVYLSHSIYGKGSEISINDSSSFYTGGGIANAYINNINQSTTGNVHGVYDMSGGAWEYVMGAMYNSDNKTIMLGSSGLSSSTINSATNQKYIDKYIYGITYSDASAYRRRQLGDATGETWGWYDDNANFVDANESWFIRGGIHNSGTSAGGFAFESYNGGTTSIEATFRLTVSAIK